MKILFFYCKTIINFHNNNEIIYGNSSSNGYSRLTPNTTTTKAYENSQSQNSITSEIEDVTESKKIYEKIDEVLVEDKTSSSDNDPNKSANNSLMVVVSSSIDDRQHNNDDFSDNSSLENEENNMKEEQNSKSNLPYFLLLIIVPIITIPIIIHFKNKKE